MNSFIASIPEFFRILWAYIVSLFFFYRKDAAPDIEAGIVPLDTIQPSEPVNSVVEVGTDGLASAHGQSQSSMAHDSDHTDSVCSDTTHRPRRASAVDPVKSRIVDSTFNKVQDRTFNVVKSVVVTHNTVIVVPYSATIEYFEIPKDSAEMEPKKERSNRAANREFKLHGVPDSSAHGYEERGHKKRRNSIDTILDMFPLPPSYIPPVPPLPVATKEILDEVILKDARRRRPSFSTLKRSSSGSSSESTNSSMFTGSASYDTTQTSPPGTPGSLRSPFSPVESSFSEIDVHQNDSCGFSTVPDTPRSARSPFSPLEPTFAEMDGNASVNSARSPFSPLEPTFAESDSHPDTPSFARSPFSPVRPTFAEIDGDEDDIYGSPVAPKVEILLWPAESLGESELRSLREPVEVDPFSLSVEYALALQEHAAADEHTASVASKHYAASSSSSTAVAESEDLTQYICPEFFASASDYDALVKFHDRNVAAHACASSANLAGKVLEAQEFDRGSEDQPLPVRDTLEISPSEEGIVDSLLSQLETSFELDVDVREGSASAQESALDWYAEQGFDREVGYGYYDFPPVAPVRPLPSVAPLRIVKKNPPKPLLPAIVEREEQQGSGDHALGKAVRGGRGDRWESSMENALKAFREAEAEDEDFRALFYRDSSCFSESSSVHKNMGRGKRYSGGSFDGFYDPERLKRLDESFESLERSMDEILADLDRMCDGVTLKSMASASRSAAGVVKNVRKDDARDDASSGSEYSDEDEDIGVDGIIPSTWRFSEAGGDDEDDERETSSGGESDHWSDILELDDYSA